HQGVVTLLDPETGRIRALLDGTMVTALRTAAVSAAASEELSQPDSRVLAVLGTGRQAREHIRAITRIRPIEKILVYGRSQNHGEDLKMEFKDLPIQLVESPLKAVGSADIICTCTASDEFLFSTKDIPRGAHINAAGACR